MRKCGHVECARETLERILLHTEASGGRCGTNVGDASSGKRLLNDSRLITRTVQRRNVYSVRLFTQHLSQKFGKWAKRCVRERRCATLGRVLAWEALTPKVTLWQQRGETFARDQ